MTLRPASLVLACLAWLCISASSGATLAQSEPAEPGGLPSVLVIGPPECPTSQELVREQRAGEGRLRMRPVAVAPADYVVRFRPWQGDYDAEIQDTAGRVRSLAGDGSGCGSLGRAVGLSLLVLVDSAAQERRASPPAPEIAAGPSIPVDPEGATWQTRVGASVGLGGVLAPQGVLGAYARVTGPVELGGWFVYSANSSINHGPGRVRLGWLAFGGDACYLFFDSFGPCGSLWLGRLRAEGEGYDRNSDVARWQPGVSFGVRLRRAFSEHWEAGFTASGLVPLNKERITVANVDGAAFTTSSLNPLLVVDIGARF
ncbi:MAG: hypothetical protein R3B89_19615 [Polyangiaceae bacterium]